LDEPPAGLDPILPPNCELILLLKQTFQMTVIVVTHEMASAFRIADRIAMLYQGSFSRSERKKKLGKSESARSAVS
jgi:phospholipid/cholesterol/gamma-HCH transport system ATP-binding protein